MLLGILLSGKAYARRVTNSNYQTVAHIQGTMGRFPDSGYEYAFTCKNLLGVPGRFRAKKCVFSWRGVFIPINNRIFCQCGTCRR